MEELKILKAKPSQKRKLEAFEEEPRTKKLKIKLSPSKSSSTQSNSKSSAPVPSLPLTIKLGPRPALESFPCCLCISMDKEGLLRVYDPPIGRKDIEEAAGNPKEWMAHEYCAQIVPETWVDEIELRGVKEKVVYGVDGIVRDRWHLVGYQINIPVFDSTHPVINRNVQPAQRIAQRCTVLQYSVQKENARKRFMCLVHGLVRHQIFSTMS